MLAMVEDAERSGALHPDSTIIEATSGNTGIGLAMVAAVKGYKLILVMPDNMSVDRRRLMLAYGAKFELTPREKGTVGAIERANDLMAEIPGAWMPRQFENAANIEQDDQQVCAGSPRACGADGARGRAGPCIALGSGGVDPGQDRLCRAHAT